MVDCSRIFFGKPEALRRKKASEGRRKREEGRRHPKEEGRGKKEEGRRKMTEARDQGERSTVKSYKY
ncbi:MAG: hypothetical protein ACMG55_06830 [Microcoleus sp.]